MPWLSGRRRRELNVFCEIWKKYKMRIFVFRMKKGFIGCLTAVLVFAVATNCNTRHAEALPDAGDWNPAVRAALNELVRTAGKDAPGYDPSCRPYAVFDYDNTTVIGDIAQNLLIYQIEQRAFAIPPERFYAVLTAEIPDLDADYGSGQTPRSLATDLARDYAALCKVDDLEKMWETPEYLDFRAKLWHLSANTDLQYPDSPFGCIWIATLLDGMLPEEIADLTRRSVGHALAEPEFHQETWTSPDGAVTVRPKKGLALTREMQSLYNVLRDNGFDVYICSASPETVVETMACDPRYGLGTGPEDVFGIRLSTHPDGTLLAVGDSTWAQPYRDGKVACIREHIAPLHGGRGPALVAGDSNGDYAMLTAFPDLRIGLIVNALRSGPIAELAAAASAAADAGSFSGALPADRPLYVVQGRDPAAKRFRPSAESLPLPTDRDQ